MKSTIHQSASDRAIFVGKAVAEFYEGKAPPAVQVEPDDTAPTGNRHERRRMAKLGRK